jgi:hypothetical protein
MIVGTESESKATQILYFQNRHTGHPRENGTTLLKVYSYSFSVKKFENQFIF